MNPVATAGNNGQSTGRITLLDPGRLGRYELPTRVIMAPMTRMRAHGNGV